MQSEQINLAWIWSKLQEGIQSNKSDYHLLQLAYINAQAFPKVDTMVCRGLANQHVYFNTDIRSQKVEAIRRRPNVSLHWYSRTEKVQIVMQAIAKIHHLDEICQEKWDSMPIFSRECYRQVGNPGQMFQEELVQLSLSDQDAFKNFAMMACDIRSLDVLLLRVGDNIRYTWTPNDQNLMRVVA